MPEAAVAAGMGDGGTERDRGPARRESQSGRGGDGGGAEDSTADAGGRSPREIAGTSDSSPAGSRESGADRDGQPGLGEADHCRRILVRGKGTARSPGPLDSPPFPHRGLRAPCSLHLPSPIFIQTIVVQSFIQQTLF